MNNIKYNGINTQFEVRCSFFAPFICIKHKMLVNFPKIKKIKWHQHNGRNAKIHVAIMYIQRSFSEKNLLRPVTLKQIMNLEFSTSVSNHNPIAIMQDNNFFSDTTENKFRAFCYDCGISIFWTEHEFNRRIITPLLSYKFRKKNFRKWKINSLHTLAVKRSFFKAQKETTAMLFWQRIIKCTFTMSKYIHVNPLKSLEYQVWLIMPLLIITVYSIIRKSVYSFLKGYAICYDIFRHGIKELILDQLDFPNFFEWFILWKKPLQPKSENVQYKTCWFRLTIQNYMQDMPV